jgi:hypothetical protein
MDNFVDSGLSGSVVGSKVINNALTLHLVAAVMSNRAINNFADVD